MFCEGERQVHHLALAVRELGLGDGVTAPSVAICGELAPPFFFTAWETFMALRVDLACVECAVRARDVADLVEGAKVAIESTLRADEDGGALANDPRKGERRASPLPCGRIGPAGWTCSREPGHSGPCAASKLMGAAMKPLELLDPPVPEPESPTANAIRQELLAVLSRPLTVQSLRRAGRIVGSAIKVLKAIEPGVESFLEPAKRRPGFPILPYGMTNPDPDAVDLDDGGMVADGPDVPAYAPPVETFGTNTFREAATSIVKLLENKAAAEREPKLDDLVGSLARAKEANLSPAVVAKLEAALEERLGGARPVREVAPTSVVVSDHDSPGAPAAATIRECSTRDVGPG